MAQEVSKAFPGAKVIDVVEPTQSESLSSSSSIRKSNFITNLEQSGLQKSGNRQRKCKMRNLGGMMKKVQEMQSQTEKCRMK